jgi:phage gp36-like protein
MPYATFDDLVDRFGDAELSQVADTVGTGEAWQATVERALSDAAAEIEAAVIGRYALPIHPSQAILTRIACDLTRESLYYDAPPDNVVERAKLARALLAKIASGALILGADLASPAATTAGLVEFVSGRKASPFR